MRQDLAQMVPFVARKDLGETTSLHVLEPKMDGMVSWIHIEHSHEVAMTKVDQIAGTYRDSP
jgi:hypothetical protein